MRPDDFLNKYQSLVELFQISEEIKEAKFNSRPYQIHLKLTRLKIAEINEDIKNGVIDSDPVILILQNMREADQQLAKGNKAQALMKWNSLLELYSDNKDFSTQMEYIQKRKAGEEVAPWDIRCWTTSKKHKRKKQTKRRLQNSPCPSLSFQ
ncbi:MAG: hypothetical protein R3C11_28790 [Planctomycetaceae bacterium]